MFRSLSFEQVCQDARDRLGRERTRLILGQTYVTPGRWDRADAAAVNGARRPVAPPERMVGPTDWFRFGSGYSGAVSIAGMLSRGDARPHAGI